MLKLWNTATRSLQEFHPLNEKLVGLYTCGPTVYWTAHIGNLRTYVFEDILLRTLEMEGYAVKRVMNITDVGHLTSDEDEGDDKMEVAAKREGKSATEIAEYYTQRFVEDAATLNIRLPQAPYFCKATEHIPEQIALIQELEKKGFTYQTSDGIYFDTAKFPNYGALSGQKLEEKEAGARVEVNEEKKNKSDFALWKFSNPTPVGAQGLAPQSHPRRQQEWPSPWGIGFPGWHIECSAMAKKYLGQPFDIHCGGVDHIPVHHENEIAQSEAAYGVKLANFWMHGEFLLVDGGKMSKSLGNVYTIADVKSRGFDPLALRLLFLGSHYRQKQNFTFEALQGAQNSLNKLRHHVRSLKTSPPMDIGGVEGVLLADFKAALEDDLNTPVALATLWKTMDDASLTDDQRVAAIVSMDRVLGLNLTQEIGRVIEIPEDIKLLAKQREDARSSRDWAESDRLRDELLRLGWIVKDTKSGSELEKK
jgi:cysteinyl-tRNA synthetase